MSVAAQVRSIGAGIRVRPRVRPTELALLAVAAVALVAGAASLGATQRAVAAQVAGASPAAPDFMPPDPRGLAAYLVALLLVHVAFVLAGRRTDQVLLPTVGLLGGIGLLLMQRLPQGLVVQRFGDAELGLGQLQLAWLLIAVAVIAGLALAVRSDAWLRLYKYTWAAIGIVLLLLTFVFGSDVNGARLTLSIGPVSGQPSELLKVILVVFLAGYLSENRSLLAEESTRLGPLRLPPIPYLAPMVAMWAIALGIVVVQRDLGAALLFFAVFLALLYVATGRPGYVVGGVILFVAGSWVLYNLFGHVQQRVDNWLDPWRDPPGCRVPDGPGPVRLRPGRPARRRPGGGPAHRRRPPADPRGPHGLPARRAWRGARADRPPRDPGAVPGGRRARAAGSRPRPMTTSGRSSPPGCRSSSGRRRSSSRPATSS